LLIFGQDFGEDYKLSIEQKVYGPDRRLALEVARRIGEQDFESDFLATSFNYNALPEVKRHYLQVRTGLIVAYPLGDVS
jgi:hypothetical protein